MISATAHDRHASEDYRRLREQGILTARDGIRWHLIEPTPGVYDFSSALPLIRAARDAGVDVIWDLCHYGWPDWLDVFAPEFVRRFARFGREFVRVLTAETDAVPFVSPVNEISFFSWAGGEVAYFNPFALGRGDELKAQLVRATLECVEAVWEVDRRARVVHADPIISVVADPSKPEEAAAAESYRLSQYQAWDMLAGRARPQLGGHPKYLDILGLNYYPHNQWIFGRPSFNPAHALPRTHALYKPFRLLIQEAFERYRRPLIIAETGAEGEARAEWLNYVCGEARAAMSAGAQLEGVCLYPIVNHPGWEDERHCHNGLWDYADESGRREIHLPLLREINRQTQLVRPEREGAERQGAGSLEAAL